MFEEGKCYTRQEIHEALGGGTDDYLPHINKQVVCGCFRLDSNPDAPTLGASCGVVLVGDGPEIYRWGKVFSEQKNHIPIFIKEDTNRWCYVGNFRVRKWEEDEISIALHSEPADRTDVVRVLKLIKAPG
jgi:hypothetical protein